ncbi:MAG TPA: hypothetical protein VIT88_08515 [Pyrinomonadaceae bacterium]
MTRVPRKIRLLLIILIVAGVVSAAIAYARPQKDLKMTRARGFTIVTQETIKLHDPKMQAHPQQADYVVTVRSQRSDGAWKEVRTRYKSGGTVLSETINFGIPGEGAYQVDNISGELQFLSPMPSKEITSYVPVIDGRNDPRYVRDDVVQRYKTYVLHYKVDSNGSYEEEYYAPELDNYPIKSVKVAPYGVAVTEMLQLIPGEPAEEVFTSLPKGLVKYDHFNQKMKNLEN